MAGYGPCPPPRQSKPWQVCTPDALSSEWVEFQTQGKQWSAKVCPANLGPNFKPKPGLADSLLHFKCMNHLRLETPEKIRSQGCENQVVYWEVEGAWEGEGRGETRKGRWLDKGGITKSATMVGDCSWTSEGNWKTVQNTCLGISLVKGARQLGYLSPYTPQPLVKDASREILIPRYFQLPTLWTKWVPVAEGQPAWQRCSKFGWGTCRAILKSHPKG